MADLTTYEFDGKEYERASTHQKEWGNKLIAELPLKGNERVLDLGCGDGVLTAELAGRVPSGSVVGIDSSQHMIDAAKERQAGNLSFIVMNINDLDFENEFDVVFSNAALHWVKDHRALLANVLRSLRDGGMLRFNFAGAGNCVHLFKVVQEAIARPEFRRHFADFVWPWYMPSVEDYTALVAQFPFRKARVWGENADRYFPDAAAMTKWVDQPSLVPFLAHVPGENKQAFRGYVVKRMVEETHQPDGTCFETFRRINVFARK